MVVVIAMDVTFSAPCPVCGSEAEWSQVPTRFEWGSVGEYGFSTEWVVDCHRCGLQVQEPSPTALS